MVVLLTLSFNWLFCLTFLLLFLSHKTLQLTHANTNCFLPTAMENETYFLYSSKTMVKTSMQLACHAKWQETHQSLEIHTESFLQGRICNLKPQAFCICGTTCFLNYTALLHTLSTWQSLPRASVNRWDPQEWQLWKILVSNLIIRKQHTQSGLDLPYITFWN
jgi:hypothetical protein